MDTNFYTWCVITGAISFLIGMLVGMTVQEKVVDNEKYINVKRG